MVLVRVDVPLRLKDQTESNDGVFAGTAFAEASLPQASRGSMPHMKQHMAIDSVNNPHVSRVQSLTSLREQLELLQMQNNKRLLKAQQEQAELEKEMKASEREKDLLESNAASREGYHVQQMVLEEENGKRLFGAWHQLAGQKIPGTNESRNQGHDAQALSGSYQERDHTSYMKHPVSMEEQSQKPGGLAEQVHNAEVNLSGSNGNESVGKSSGPLHWRTHDCNGRAELPYRMANRGMDNARCEDKRAKSLMHQKMVEDATLQSTVSRSATNNQVGDRWGKGPFPAGEGVIAGYQAQFAALESARREAAAETSQAEAEIFRMSGRLPSVGPGGSCAPHNPHSAFMWGP